MSPVIADFVIPHTLLAWGADVKAEVTLSKWLDEPTYEIPKFGFWEKN